MTLSSGLWSKLPLEILERTLSLLPVPVLCRYRTVCKKWNTLICTPEFNGLCVQNANLRDASCIVARYVRGESRHGKHPDKCGQHHGWSFLDLNERRWYSIEYYGQNLLDVDFESGHFAMQGGLVCQYFSSDLSDRVSIFVSNPLTNRTQKLPPPPHHPNDEREFPLLAMIVDALAHTYKIFLVKRGIDRVRPVGYHPFLHIYDSSSNQWRTSPTRPPLELGVGFEADNVFFQGLLYILGSSLQETEYWLWSYNPAADEWKDAGMHSHNDELFRPQLVVSDNRLFLVAWVDSTDTRSIDYGRIRKWTLDLSEILVVDGVCKGLVRKTRADVLRFFDARNPSAPESVCPSAIRAFGLGKSILLVSERSGMAMVYDVQTASWDRDRVPRNPAMREPREGSDERAAAWFAKPMPLLLPSYPVLVARS